MDHFIQFVVNNPYKQTKKCLCADSLWLWFCNVFTNRQESTAAVYTDRISSNTHSSKTVGKSIFRSDKMIIGSQGITRAAHSNNLVKQHTMFCLVWYLITYFPQPVIPRLVCVLCSSPCCNYWRLGLHSVLYVMPPQPNLLLEHARLLFLQQWLRVFPGSGAGGLFGISLQLALFTFTPP